MYFLLEEGCLSVTRLRRRNPHKYNKGLSVTLDQPNIALQNFNLYNNQNYKNPFTSENKGVGFNNKFYFFGNNILLGYNNSKFNPLTSVNKDLVVPMETLALSVNLDSDNFDLLSFTTGLIKEENTFLLSEGSGAFDLNDKDNLSNFYGFNFSKSLSSFGNISLYSRVIFELFCMSMDSHYIFMLTIQCY